METAIGKCGFELKNERGDTLLNGKTQESTKIMNTMFQKKAGLRDRHGKA